ncbi:MAG: glutathione peroxidase [Bacteriovoracaceae bacterium]|nr:glutathione peroxidase [Bacteriovoracaceae bacterium]
MSDLYGYKVKDINGADVSLEDYKGKVLLIVNTASKCGFTPQYTGLNELYNKYSSDGFEVLGFPCNQFGKQEPGSDEEIKSFCDISFKINFPMFSKVDVNGGDAAPLYDYLKAEAPGLLGSKAVKWNFTKFLVDKDGNVLKRFAPKDTPESIEREVKELL